MLISAIVPHRDKGEFLGQALLSLRRQTVRPDEIIVIDDGSNFSVTEITDGFPEIKLIALPRSHGAATARNLGMNLARGSHLLFLDSDVALAPDCLEHLIVAAKSTPIVYPTISYRDGKRMYPVTDVHRSFLAISTVFLIENKDLRDRHLYFDPLYRIYYEDLDFFSRCHLAGMAMAHAEGAQAVHLNDVTALPHPDYRSRRFSYETRNALYYYLKFNKVPGSKKPPVTIDKRFLLRLLGYAIANLYWPCHAFAYDETESILDRIRLYFGPHQKIDRTSLPLYGHLIKAVAWNILHCGHLGHDRKIIEGYIKKCSIK